MNAKRHFSVLCTVTAMLIAAHCAAQAPAAGQPSAQSPAQAASAPKEYKPTGKVNTTAVTDKPVTLTATFSSDSVKQQYSLDNKTWSTYSNGVKLTEKGTVYFREIDAAGNVSPVVSLSYKVSSIDTTNPLVVTTALDVVDANDGVISLREAVANAKTRGVGAVITFANDFTIQLRSTLLVSQNIVIDGGDNAITVIGSKSAPMFKITGNGMTLKNMTVTTDYSGKEAGIADITTGKHVKLYRVSDGGSAKLLWQVSGNSDIVAYDSSSLHRAIIVPDTSVWGTGQIQLFSGSVLDNASVTGQQARDGGDVLVSGGTIKNVTAKGKGDIYVYSGSCKGIHAENNAMVRQYAESTVNGMAIDFGGIYVYDGGAILTGTISISGTVKAHKSGSVVADMANLVFDLTSRTGDSRFSFEHPHPDTASVSDCPIQIDDMNAFLGAGSYTVSILADQAYGTYLLAGNAANFDSVMSLKIGNNTYKNNLSVGRSITIGEKLYSLKLDADNNLAFSIAIARRNNLRRPALPSRNGR